IPEINFFVRDLQGNDLLSGNHRSDLYAISLQDTTSPTSICFMAKGSPTHLNFDSINLLSKKDIVIGLPKLKYVNDQLCLSCELSKAKRSTFKIKGVPSLKGWLNLLHMDLCGPMHVKSINGKKYIMVLQVSTSLFFPTDNSKQQDTPPKMNIHSSTEPTTPTTNVNAEENFNNQAAYTQFQ
ncbi:hypothetical protein Tco_1115327, partial [Tanacetum coccineum]